MVKTVNSNRRNKRNASGISQPVYLFHHCRLDVSRAGFVVFDRFFGDDGDRLEATWHGMTYQCPYGRMTSTFTSRRAARRGREGLEITVHKGVLTVKGESRGEEGREYTTTAEVRVGSSGPSRYPSRSIPRKVEAALTNGVLRVRLAKLPQAKPRKIAPKTS